MNDGGNETKTIIKICLIQGREYPPKQVVLRLKFCDSYSFSVSASRVTHGNVRPKRILYNPCRFYEVQTNDYGRKVLKFQRFPVFPQYGGHTSPQIVTE